MTAKMVKIPTSRKLSNLSGPSMKYRTQNAPINASLMLLTNQDRIIKTGTPLWSCTARCAGNTPSRTIHHALFGVSNRAASKIALGGQRVETE